MVYDRANQQTFQHLLGIDNGFWETYPGTVYDILDNFANNLTWCNERQIPLGWGERAKTLLVLYGRSNSFHFNHDSCTVFPPLGIEQWPLYSF